MLGALVAGLWSAQAVPLGWRQALALLVLILTGLAGGWAWWRAPPGELRWGEGGWSWIGPAGVRDGRLAHGLDLQTVLLLRWQDEGARGRSARWFWLERARCPDRWQALRRAVYSRARRQALPDAGLPAATP